MYPFVSSMLFQALNCREVDGNDYLHADYSINCASVQYKRLEAFSCTAIVLVLIGMPILYVALLLPHQTEILSLLERNTKASSSRHLLSLIHI